MKYKYQDIVIVAAKRTPLGNMLGSLSTKTAPELGAIAHKAVLAATNLLPTEIDEVISGCVLPAGIGQAPARQAAIFADLPFSVGATTINKVCGSGMKAVMLAHDLIRSNSANIVLAGGMESMSNAPYLLSKARSGYRLGHGELKDHMFVDGLEDAYDRGKLMGYFADLTACELKISREEQDELATESLVRAMKAQQGAFLDEIAPVTLKDTIVDKDEGPNANKFEKIKRLRPAFTDTGTVTAANASSISDGAASLILMTYQNAKAHGLQPLAKIVAHATHSQEPALFTTAPIDAIKKILLKANWNINEVDLFEINEAFAVVVLAALKALKINYSKVNINGGACALGHPIGASGARIIVTLIHALKLRQLHRGIASLCIGGGEATAIALEL